MSSRDLTTHGEKQLTFLASSTYFAFDTVDAAAFVKKMKSLGVNIGACGKETVRLRPMLIFGEADGKQSHAVAGGSILAN